MQRRNFLKVDFVKKIVLDVAFRSHESQNGLMNNINAATQREKWAFKTTNFDMKLFSSYLLLVNNQIYVSKQITSKKRRLYTNFDRWIELSYWSPS